MTFHRIALESAYPVRIFNRRTSCLCCFKSLFHETKQMGIVLRRAFKGSHIWIPPIKDQIPEGSTPQMKVDLSNHTNPVKIDAMLFTATEEPLVLIGSDP